MADGGVGLFCSHIPHNTPNTHAHCSHTPTQQPPKTRTHLANLLHARLQVPKEALAHHPQQRFGGAGEGPQPPRARGGLDGRPLAGLQLGGVLLGGDLFW